MQGPTAVLVGRILRRGLAQSVLLLVIGAPGVMGHGEPARGGMPLPISATIAGGQDRRPGLPFGPFHLPDAEFRAPFSGSLRGVSSAQEALAALEAARRTGFRLVLRLARGSSRFENPDRSFNLARWKREIDRYRDIDFAPYIRDGTLLGHFIFDEPHDPTNWNGKPVAYADIAAAAAYSKELWPTMPTGIGSPPTALQQLRGTADRGALDFAFAQYGPKKGEVQQWLSREKATARRLGYGMILSMNVLDGNNRDPLTAAQVRRYGLVLAQEPTACLLTMWKYDQRDPSYFKNADMIAAMEAVARVAAARSAGSCLPSGSAALSQRRPAPISATDNVVAAEVVLVGAGDIADCDTAGERATARLLDEVEGIVFTLGDHAYPDGTVDQFSRCYAPTWGRHKARTRPSPGNHDYHVTGAIPYYDYFGAASGSREKGYYSYDAGAWHVIVLNTSIPIGAKSEQIQWLRADLAAHPRRCTLAYFHRARFSSGRHGSSTTPLAAWRVLYETGADVVLSGHDHLYERFAPQTPDGTADSVRGIRQFTVGTGGAGLSTLGSREPNSELLDNTHYGVLKLHLGQTGYRWFFLNAADGSALDSGSAACR
jgi:calcineurin-like phosphoesterase family protein